MAPAASGPPTLAVRVRLSGSRLTVGPWAASPRPLLPPAGLEKLDFSPCRLGGRELFGDPAVLR